MQKLASFRGLALILALLVALVPGFAQAAGGENVVLEFSSSDQIYLAISFGFGLIALIAGWFVAVKVKKVSPGDAKMQEVGAAIKDGAMAYLRQQMQMMLPFVLILGVGLWAMNRGAFGNSTALFMAVSFLGGVAASYIAGYSGMVMAVQGNMRTAAMALTSYKKSLEVAFQSGAVAGLVTVGMGLIGASIIFFLGGQQAMKLLVGFGFGGSLAALFMRVGGGIYTKAADVGADLVGKVEAGIPEDDPRNPATIADNVGDNVGDCAGMAADVFESYEVTLVAAIILGAATAAIFDQQTWMRLILFALMARGVGIIASIIGIFSVRGSDNLDSDPLMSIRKGFYSSATIAAIGTVALAFFMMGGQGNAITTSQLTDVNELQRVELMAIKDIQRRLAKDKKVALYEVTADDVMKDPKAQALKLNGEEGKNKIASALATNVETMPKSKDLSGYSKLDFAKPPAKIAAYSAPKAPPENQAPGTPPPGGYTTFVDRYKGTEMVVYDLKVTTTQPAAATEPGKPAPPPETRTIELSLGPIDKKQADKLIEQAKTAGTKVEIIKTIPAHFYASGDGKIAIGVDGSPASAQLQGPRDVQYFVEDVKTLDKLDAARKTDFSKPFPQAVPVDFATVKHKSVEWWRFGLCILFGILMAFAFEWLTDYYVSTHKKPVQEVGNVATAGPAPMIIQGFAYAQESSVFSVFAIVIALITPLFIFPPAEFGGYLLSFYGIALVGLGLLTTTGFILAMDTFGPISDNAQGVFEMSGAGHTSESGSKAVQRLDAAGNTTKALTKGFAIATAVVAAVALFHTFVEEGKLTSAGLSIDVPEIFLGLMIGGAAPYLFSAFSINAVGRASFQLIGEVRRQFRNDPGIMAGTSKPDYGRCVAIVTKAAQKELLGPGILAIALPVFVAFGFSIATAMNKNFTTIGDNQYNLVGAQALGGFLAGAILSGQLMAVLLANSGGMWDNAKKLIEDGLHGGKGTEAHKAGIVCDTVGDPFKDTAGPAMNPLIKVMNLVALLLAPTVIQPYEPIVPIIATIAAFLALAIAFYMSKKGSLSTELSAMTAEAASQAPLPQNVKEEVVVMTPGPTEVIEVVDDKPEEPKA
ncbi:MAG: sodium/proton-translocating pyrophosphatase [Fimbriimonadaceae bacterium]|nr:sodium/proton-translocating pyrophosphatase [Fimbriimonadaceae bacterium]